MNKNMFSGWKDVMAFSYVQTMKSRAMKITLVVLCLICICIFPVYSLIKANTSTESEIGAFGVTNGQIGESNP